ncbi:MAG: hypothetical protein D6758_08850 [Gammaproteobacteria bacterium]|nr:MAG: hypothetical protein D6758_08850 [Gammaproteobacteria bacterium]
MQGCIVRGTPWTGCRPEGAAGCGGAGWYLLFIGMGQVHQLALIIRGQGFKPALEASALVLTGNIQPAHEKGVLQRAVFGAGYINVIDRVVILAQNDPGTDVPLFQRDSECMCLFLF